MSTAGQRPPLLVVLGLTLGLTCVATLVFGVIGLVKHRRERQNRAIMTSSNVHPNGNANADAAAVKPLAGAKQQGRLSPTFLSTMVQAV